MSLRISSALAALLALAACGGGVESPEPEGDTVDCAVGPGAEYSSVCTVEWLQAEWDGEFIIHHPDGSFRRMQVTPDGIASFDGAAEVVNIGDYAETFVEFSVDGDRYRLPAAPYPGD